jgi:hypothetical protein
MVSMGTAELNGTCFLSSYAPRSASKAPALLKSLAQHGDVSSVFLDQRRPPSLRLHILVRVDGGVALWRWQWCRKSEEEVAVVLTRDMRVKARILSVPKRTTVGASV